MKIKIANNDYEEQLYKTLIEDKQSSFNALTDYLKDYIELSSIDFSKSELKTSILELFINTYRSQFPSIVPDEKIIEFTNFSVSKLSSLIEVHKGIDIEFDYKTKKCPSKDFGVYVTNENQLNKYNELNALSKILNDNDEKVMRGVMPRQQLTNILGFIVQYDYQTNLFKPNIQHVLSN